MWAVIGAVTAAIVGIIFWRWRAGRKPEARLARLEQKLLQAIKAGRDENECIREMLALGDFVKAMLEEGNVAVTARGIDAIKTALGEYLHTAENRAPEQSVFLPKIMPMLVRLFTAAIKTGPVELASFLADAFRLIGAEAIFRSEEEFSGVVEQLTSLALMTIREKKLFLSGKIIEYLFLLTIKAYRKGAVAHGYTVLKSLTLLGQMVIRRKETGLMREIINQLTYLAEELRQKREAGLEPCWQQVMSVLLLFLAKAIDVKEMEIAEGIMDNFYGQLAVAWPERGAAFVQLARDWSAIGKTAVMTTNVQAAVMVVTRLIALAEAVVEQRKIYRKILESAVAIPAVALQNGTAKDAAPLVVPLLNLGRTLLQQELKSTPLTALEPSYRQEGLKLVLDQITFLGTIVFRRGDCSMGEFIATVHNHWLKQPENSYRHGSAGRFSQLWFLYWLNNRRRAARREADDQPVILEKMLFKPEELERLAFTLGLYSLSPPRLSRDENTP